MRHGGQGKDRQVGDLQGRVVGTAMSGTERESEAGGKRWLIVGYLCEVYQRV